MAVSDLIQSWKSFFTQLFAIPPRSESMAGVIILFVFTNSVATSIWMFNAWSPFVFRLFGESNMMVGLMSGVNGIFELSFALISGHIADKILGHSRTLLFAVRFGIVNLLVALVAVWSGKVWMLVVAQMFEGTYMGLSFTCVESVFAQCLRRGERDRLYSIKFSFEAAGPIIGLLMSIVLFAVVGNSWDVSVLRWVITAGLTVHLASMVTFLMHFVPLPSIVDARKAKDVAIEDAPVAQIAAAPAALKEVPQLPSDTYEVEDQRLHLEEDDMNLNPMVPPGPSTELANRARTAMMSAWRVAPHGPHGQYEPSVCTAPLDPDAMSVLDDIRNSTFFAAPDGNSDGERGEREVDGERGQPDARGGNVSNRLVVDEHEIDHSRPFHYEDVELENATGCRRSVMECIPFRLYPYYVAAADVVLILGSGMTTQYFTLFMMKIYGVGPILMAVLNLLNAFLISGLAILGGMMGKRFGRIRAIIPSKLIGAFILLYMALSRGTEWGPKWAMCVAYVMRNALMNCSSGLSRALIMDLVSESSRGRWNAVESIQSAGWSGTAILGGYLADKLGYGAAFIFTFVFHFTATVSLVPLAVRNDSRLPIVVYDDVDADAQPEAMATGCGGGQSGKTCSSKGSRVSEDGVVVAELTAANIERIVSCANLHDADAHNVI